MIIRRVIRDSERSWKDKYDNAEDLVKNLRSWGFISNTDKTWIDGAAYALGNNYEEALLDFIWKDGAYRDIDSWLDAIEFYDREIGHYDFEAEIRPIEPPTEDSETNDFIEKTSGGYTVRNPDQKRPKYKNHGVVSSREKANKQRAAMWANANPNVKHYGKGH